MTAASASADEPVRYSRDIKPILAGRCYACHGPDPETREADLRLDERASAVEIAIKPGDPKASSILERITSDDPEMVMPPPAAKKPAVTPAESDLIRRWIEQGAKFDQHWSYEPVTRPEVPKDVGDAKWSSNPIDAFLASSWKEHGLAPNAEADRVTLIRRLSFDVLGLPPTPAEVDAFVSDTSPDAYEKLVDRLLANPAFGERLAVFWLDAVRYADTGGYHSDNERDVWLYRDWVIDAFNKNKPFDRFTIEQLAGDLLPDATRETRIGSGYNRLLMTTEEGGAQPKEYRVKYDADRVRNASSVWLGATLGCAECHDHKFDPYKTKDFYRFGAFFADVKDKPVGRQEQTPLPTPEQAGRVAELDAKVAAAQEALDEDTPELAAAQSEWEGGILARDNAWEVAMPTEVSSEPDAELQIRSTGEVWSRGPNPDKSIYYTTLKTSQHGITGFRMEVNPNQTLPNDGPGRSTGGNFVLSEIEITTEDGTPIKLTASASHSQAKFPGEATVDGKLDTGWAIMPLPGKSHALFLECDRDLGKEGEETTFKVKLVHNYGDGHNIGVYRFATTTSERPVRAYADPASGPEISRVLAIAPDERTEKDQKFLKAEFRKIYPELKPKRDALLAAMTEKQKYMELVPTSLVSMPAKPRTMRVLPRGNWLDETGEVVSPGVSDFLPNLETSAERATRLDLAHWMVARNNPLVARVAVNRFWKLMFGHGIVRTVDDFGSQGAWPSHPALLDWMSAEFMESGWDVKRLIRTMVTSNAYRQSSKPSSTVMQSDPTNEWFARQDRFRLDAEFVRDNALAISGLLVRKVGGPSVKPYQPEGYWQYLNFPRREYTADKGEKQYRRGLYTHWQRSFLHPSLQAFDAPSREECTVDRPRSNTPLQALVLLDDPTYVEAARALADKAISSGSTPTDRVAYAMRSATGRAPDSRESEILISLYQKHREQFTADPESAKKLLAIGEFGAANGADPVELAAWTSVARVILNLHETVTRN